MFKFFPLLLTAISITLAHSRTFNLENKYEYTYQTVCNSNLNFEFKFHNYYFSNVTSFNYVQNNANIVFLVDNLFKNSRENIDLIVSKNLYNDKQVINFLFTGSYNEVKNVLKINLFLENCINFRNILQYSIKNDKNSLLTETLDPDKDNNFVTQIPSFERSSDQVYKFYFVDNLVYTDFILPLSLNILILLICVIWN